MRKLTRPEEEAKYFKYPAPVVEISPRLVDGEWFVDWRCSNKPSDVLLKVEQRQSDGKGVIHRILDTLHRDIEEKMHEEGWIRLIFFFEDKDGNRSPEREEFFPLNEKMVNEKYGNKKEKEMNERIKIDEYGEVPKELYGKPEKEVEEKLTGSVLVDGVYLNSGTVKGIIAENKKLKEERDVAVKGLLERSKQLAKEKKEIEALEAENKELEESRGMAVKVLGERNNQLLLVKTENERLKKEVEALKEENFMPTEQLESETVEALRAEMETVKGKPGFEKFHYDFKKQRDGSWELQWVIGFNDDLQTIQDNGKDADLYCFLSMAKYRQGDQIAARGGEGKEGALKQMRQAGESSFGGQFLLKKPRTDAVEITIHAVNAVEVQTEQRWETKPVDWMKPFELTIPLPKEIAVPVPPEKEMNPGAAEKTALLNEIQENRNKFLREGDTGAANKWLEIMFLVQGRNSTYDLPKVKAWLDDAIKKDWKRGKTTLPKVIAFLEKNQ